MKEEKLALTDEENNMSNTLSTTQHKGYETCNDCDGLVIDVGSQWLGENKDGRGEYIAYEECEDCGRHRSSKHFE